MKIDQKLTLLDLPWQDVLFVKLLPSLELEDLFKLRRVSVEYKRFVESYLSVMTEIDLSTRAGFNSEAFKVITSHCRNIRRVRFKGCTFLCDNHLMRLVRLNPKIVSLDISFCKNVTTISFHNVVINCKGLKELNVNGCCWLTEGALDLLMYHHSDLESINLSDCPHISESTILKLIVRFQNLKVLHLHDNFQITSQTARTIAYHCKNLLFLSLHGSTLTPNDIRLVIDQCPRLIWFSWHPKVF